MRLAFTTTNAPMSRLIRKVTGEDCSHCAILTDQFAVHANLYGVIVEPLYDFESRVEIVHTLEVSPNYERLLNAFFAKGGSLYDFGALFYLGARAVFPSLPKKNLWQCSGMYLCTEWVMEYLGETPDPMITPYKLYLRLRDKLPSAG